MPTRNQSYLRVLTKKDSDPTLPGSYRPISLINIDAKILSQIIAHRLAVVLLLLINPAQQGFIRGRLAVTNIRKVLMSLEEAQLLDFATITLDAEKAFDNMQLPWLFMV